MSGFPVGLELRRNIRIGNVYLKFKLIDIIAELGEWMGENRGREWTEE